MNSVKIYFHHPLSQKLSFRLQLKLLCELFKATSFPGTLSPSQLANNHPILEALQQMLDTRGFLDPKQEMISLCFLTVLNSYFFVKYL